MYATGSDYTKTTCLWERLRQWKSGVKDNRSLLKLVSVTISILGVAFCEAHKEKDRSWVFAGVGLKGHRGCAIDRFPMHRHGRRRPMEAYIGDVENNGVFKCS